MWNVHSGYHRWTEVENHCSSVKYIVDSNFCAHCSVLKGLIIDGCFLAPCSLVEVYRHFKSACYFQYQVMILVMEAACTSEMLVNFYYTTWHTNSQDGHLHTHCIVNLKFHRFNNSLKNNKVKPGCVKERSEVNVWTWKAGENCMMSIFVIYTSYWVLLGCLNQGEWDGLGI
jgi:hypothetical protein